MDVEQVVEVVIDDWANAHHDEWPAGYGTWRFNVGGKIETMTGWYEMIVKSARFLARMRRVSTIYLMA